MRKIQGVGRALIKFNKYMGVIACVNNIKVIKMGE